MYTKIKAYKENILVPRNLDDRKEKAKQQAIKLLSQETIDGDFKLEEYMLDIPEHLIKVKTINGLFVCSELHLTEFPKWFERLTINDSFRCYGNQLTSLKGCPQTINGNFECHSNQLTSLKGCPQTINGSFSCQFNKLVSLKYCPEIINGSFYCYSNRLRTLKNCPQTINGDFYCYNNVFELDRPKNCNIKGAFVN